MAYTKVNWQDLPSTSTPRNATNLGHMDDGIEANDKRLNGTSPMGNIVVDTIRSKNLFDKNNTYVGYFASNGSIQSNSDYCYSDYISVDGFGKITISGVSNTGNAHIIEYNSNKEYVNFWGTRNQTITLNSNTKYIRISTHNDNKNTLQAEEGDTATTYAPYQALDKINDLIAYNDTSVLVNPTKIPITPLVGSNYSGFGNSFYYKIGSRVHIHLGLENLTPNTNQTVFAPPAGYKPVTSVAGAGVGGSMSEVVPYQLGNSVALRSPSQYALVDIEYDAFS